MIVRRWDPGSQTGISWWYDFAIFQIYGLRGNLEKSVEVGSVTTQVSEGMVTSFGNRRFTAGSEEIHKGVAIRSYCNYSGKSGGQSCGFGDLQNNPILVIIKTQSYRWIGILLCSIKVGILGIDSQSRTRKDWRIHRAWVFKWEYSGISVYSLKGEVPEEGEIKGDAENFQPSLEFQMALQNKQAQGSQVISDPFDEVQGLEAVTNMMENKNILGKEDAMDMDEIRACLLENGIDMDSEDFLKENPEENFEEMLKQHEEEAMEEGEDCVEAEEQRDAGEAKDTVGGEQEKNKGLRKRTAKPQSNTLGSNKMRSAVALLSPRKKTTAKGGANRATPSRTTRDSQSRRLVIRSFKFYGSVECGRKALHRGDGRWFYVFLWLQ
ncbi:unnamed protein product [Eruca vesicaria subsp. sativa]|uniref:Uncharacterized protein n=1 Tax=Eruca vesicaria subsp. sativa TaxID=29727 RepID=A0ABC8KEP8_ERUVS|nr:unnamed protein product [Eruca vesicaria subsp. sativa]